jgi:hypothetical protein
MMAITPSQRQARPKKDLSRSDGPNSPTISHTKASVFSRHEGFAVAAIAALSYVNKPLISLAKIVKWTADSKRTDAVLRFRKLMKRTRDALVDTPIVGGQKSVYPLTKQRATIAKAARKPARPNSSSKGSIDRKRLAVHPFRARDIWFSNLGQGDKNLLAVTSKFEHKPMSAWPDRGRVRDHARC